MSNEILVGGISVSCFQSIKQVINNIILNNAEVKPGIGIAINPEKIISSIEDEKMREIINSATLRYPDGIGVSYVMSKKHGQHVARIPGCELWEQLMITSAIHNIPVFLVGASEEVVIQTKDKLQLLNVNVVGYQNGFFNQSDEASILQRMKDSGAKIISVALGSPRQELFIFKCIDMMPDTFFMGVGGTYDVFTGNVKRSPYFFRKIHCEWLYRLISQPTRISRQINLIKYLYLYFRGKL